MNIHLNILCFYFSFNGQPVNKCNVVINIIQPAKQAVLLEAVDPLDITQIESIMVSDSSESRAYVFEAEQLRFIKEFPFEYDEMQQSSTLRELLAVVKMFEQESFLQQNRHKTVVWCTDNRGLVSILNRGSRVEILQRHVINIKLVQLQFDIILLPVWQRRSTLLLKIADEGSKVSNTDEWSVALEDYNLICEKFMVMPEIDLMASAANTKCSAFYSKLPDKTALGTDFFIQELDNKRVMYICPPVKVIVPALHKILSIPSATIVFVIPLWQSACFWSQFIEAGKFKSFIKRIFVFKTIFTSEAADCMFKGICNFSMIALLIKT